MVIDTVNDVVIGDIGNDLVNTGGVAVRPFWWSTECLVELGLAGATAGSEATKGGGSPDTAADGGVSGLGTASGSADVNAGGPGGLTLNLGGDSGHSGAGLGGGWVALIVVLAVIGAGSLGGLTFLLGRSRRASGVTPIVVSEVTAVQPAATQGETTEVVAVEKPFTPAFCSGCGGPLSRAARFCPHCGLQLG